MKVIELRRTDAYLGPYQTSMMEFLHKKSIMFARNQATPPDGVSV